MYSKSNLFLIFIFLSGFNSFSQTSAKSDLIIKGIIIDFEAREGIPFAHIKLENHSQGGLTNKEGKFTLHLKDVTQSDTLTFSSVGYDKKVITIKDLPDTILLKQESLVLRDIVVKAERKSLEEELL